MATTEEGSVNRVPAVVSQANKITTLNDADTVVEDAAVGALYYDAVSASGTVVLTEPQSRNGMINIFGATSGNVTLEIDADVEQTYWVRDESTGHVITLQQTGGSGPDLPKDRWIAVRARASGVVEHVMGWSAGSEAGAITHVANYGVVSGRALSVHKCGGEPAAAGGLVRLEGAVEETTTDPVEGDVIATLPVGMRPAFAVGFSVVADPAVTSSAVSVVVEIQTNGDITLREIGSWASPRTSEPIDLTGVSFFSGG